MLIEYRHLPHETLTQDLPSHEKWARLRAKNEIGQISSKTENVAILLSDTAKSREILISWAEQQSENI